MKTAILDFLVRLCVEIEDLDFALGILVGLCFEN
jgi:hypothetical protein